ncbi:MAG: DNA polymerase I, partial [Acidocella sp. 20-61-6]
MQLLGPGVSMLDPMKNIPIGPAEVEAKFGVTPDKVVEVQALIGDPVDNVPGVPGIGPKGAAQLIQEYGTLEAVLEAAPSMKPSKRREMLIAHADKARISKELVKLRDDAPLPEPLDALALRHWDDAVLGAFLEANNFKSIRHKLNLSEGAPVAAPRAESAAFGGYETVTTLAALEALLAQARDAGRVALDVQTDDRNSLHGNLIGIALAVAPGKAGYLPLGHNLGLEDPPQLALAEVLAALAPLLGAPGVLKIFHDAKYNLEVLLRAGATQVAPIDDVMLISYAQDAGNFAHDAVTLAQKHLAHTPKDFDSVAGSGRNRLAFANVPMAGATAYAAEAADVSLRLWEMLKPQLRVNKALALYELLEKPLVRILAGMELHGVMVDRDDLRAMSAEFERRMAEIEKDVI